VASGTIQALGRMNWSFEFEEVEGPVDTDGPLIYLWEVFDHGGNIWYWYIGKAVRGADRPRTQYRRNVENLLAGKPYRKSKPNAFRLSHQRMAEATKLGLRIRLSFVCNVAADESINVIERHWQRHYAVVYTKAQQTIPADRPKAGSG
jgi:hypothetical protein